MQTHEWEALLDGTTPGPWFANVRGLGRIKNIGPITTGYGLDCDEDDAILAAHAPAAVAEVIRLRQALEGRLRVWEKVADRLAAQGDNGAELMRIALNQITRILEGDTDE